MSRVLQSHTASAVSPGKEGFLKRHSRTLRWIYLLDISILYGPYTKVISGWYVPVPQGITKSDPSLGEMKNCSWIHRSTGMIWYNFNSGIQLQQCREGACSLLVFLDRTQNDCLDPKIVVIRASTLGTLEVQVGGNELAQRVHIPCY